MSLKTICQSVAKEIGLTVPSAFVGSNDKTARQLLACASKAGKSIARRRGKFGSWADLITEYTFDSVADQADYDLPSDYDRLVDGTLWDRDNYWDLRGPLSPAEWQVYKSSVLGSSVSLRARVRIRNVSGTRKFSLDPTPSTSGVTFVYEYVSKNWCESSGGTGQTDWAADTDTGVISEYLIELETLWRMLNRLGLAYAEEKEEAEKEIMQAISADAGAPTLSLSARRKVHLIDAGNIPDTGYGS